MKRDLDAPDALMPVARLRTIARQLEAIHETGGFQLCFEHVRDDMATLPAQLNELADELGRLGSERRKRRGRMMVPKPGQRRSWLTPIGTRG